MRTESRGAHFRSDFPHSDDTNWLKNIIVSKEGDEDVFYTEPVELNYLNEVDHRYDEFIN